MLNFGSLLDFTSQQLACVYVQPQLVLEHSGLSAAEQSYQGFLRAVHTRPVLLHESLLYQNLRQHELDPSLSAAYVQANLQQFAPYSLTQLQEAHQFISSFAPREGLTPTELDLAIGTLLQEHLAPAGQQHVNRYFQALQHVINSLVSPGPEPLHETVVESPYTLAQLVDGASLVLQEQLAHLSPAEQELLFALSSPHEAARQRLFERYYAQAAELLREHAESDAARRLASMHYDQATVKQDLLDLHELLAD
jgi:hypothetical protein